MAKRRPKPKGDIERPDLGLELGVPNYMPTTSWQAFNPAIPKGTLALGRDPLAPDLNELVFMLRRDGQAQAMLNLLTLPLRAAFAKSTWVHPDENGDNEAPEVKFANDMWTLPPQAGGMKNPRSMFLKQTLLAIPHGFSAFEVVKDYREDGPLAGKFVIDKLAYRDPRSVTMLASEHGDFGGFHQKAVQGSRLIDKVIQKENAWYWAANEEQNPFYGVSYFEPAFQHYQAKRKMYYIGEIAAQLSAVPARLGFVAPGASPRQIAEFKKGLAELQFSMAMLVPPNFDVKPFNANTGFDFLKIIDHHNASMVKSILAGFLQQDDRTILIDNGKADASADMFVQLIEAIGLELAESFSTRLMPQFIDYNFGSGVYPVFKLAPLTDSNREAIEAIFTTIVGLQTINCTPEFVRSTEIEMSKRFGYDIDYEAVANEEEEAAAEMEKQAAEEAAFQKQAQQAQLDATKAAATAAKNPGQGNPGSPKSQGANKQENGRPSPAPTAAGGRPPGASKPTMLKASSAKQAEAIDTIALALQELIDEGDVPEDYSYAPETLPEADPTP